MTTTIACTSVTSQLPLVSKLVVIAGTVTCTVTACTVQGYAPVVTWMTRRYRPPRLPLLMMQPQTPRWSHSSSIFSYSASTVEGEASDGEDDADVAIAPSETSSSSASSSSKSSPSTSTSPLARLKAMFQRPNDGLSARERLGKMGLSALLSYGFVSNMSYAVCVSIAWYMFTARVGLSPLAPGQWKPFLAVYATFYVFNNIVRPVRLGVSAIIATYFDTVIDGVERRTRLSRKWSIGIVIFLANFCGTILAMGLGISLASTASGVPIFPIPIPKA